MGPTTTTKSSSSGRKNVTLILLEFYPLFSNIPLFGIKPRYWKLRRRKGERKREGYEYMMHYYDIILEREVLDSLIEDLNDEAEHA